MTNVILGSNGDAQNKSLARDCDQPGRGSRHTPFGFGKEMGLGERVWQGWARGEGLWGYFLPSAKWLFHQETEALEECNGIGRCCRHGFGEVVDQMTSCQ